MVPAEEAKLYIQKQEIISIEGILIKTAHAKKVELEYLTDLRLCVQGV
jgi:hypothetical protein